MVSPVEVDHRERPRERHQLLGEKSRKCAEHSACAPAARWPSPHRRPSGSCARRAAADAAAAHATVAFLPPPPLRARQSRRRLAPGDDDDEPPNATDGTIHAEPLRFLALARAAPRGRAGGRAAAAAAAGRRRRWRASRSPPRAPPRLRDPPASPVPCSCSRASWKGADDPRLAHVGDRGGRRPRCAGAPAASSPASRAPPAARPPPRPASAAPPPSRPCAPWPPCSSRPRAPSSRGARP